MACRTHNNLKSCNNLINDDVRGSSEWDRNVEVYWFWQVQEQNKTHEMKLLHSYIQCCTNPNELTLDFLPFCKNLIILFFTIITLMQNTNKSQWDIKQPHTQRYSQHDTNCKVKSFFYYFAFGAKNLNREWDPWAAFWSCFSFAVALTLCLKNNIN